MTTGTAGAQHADADPALQTAHADLHALLARKYPGLPLDQLQNGQRERLREELRRRQADQDVELLQATMRLLHALSDQSPETAAAIGVNLENIRAQHVAISDVYVTHVQAEQPPAPGDPPYKGLAYFDVEDAPLFFGREALTAELVDYLREHRFLAVVGASGSGKSSLARAGLIPALQRGEPLDDGVLPPAGSEAWPHLLLTPTDRPLERLAHTLIQQGGLQLERSALEEELLAEPDALHRYAQQIVDDPAADGPAADGSTEHRRLLLVVDQFEEFFTAARAEDDPRQAEGQRRRQAFVDNLLTATVETGPTIVVLTLRADFYAQVTQFDNLRQALGDLGGSRQKYIGPMSEAELRRAIEQPLRPGDWSIEPDLVDQLLRDVSDEPGALPLLSHALLETWTRRRGRTLTLAGYIATGRVQGAVARSAEAVYRKLTPAQQEIARHIFVRLTELGEGAEDTRRRVVREELVTQPGERHEVEAVLEILSNADDRQERVRLITMDEDEVEVTHEALIRQWKRLRDDWLGENRENLLIHRRLTQASLDWQNNDYDADYLYPEARLEQADRWARDHGDDMNDLERQFLDESRSAVQRSRRNRRLAVAAIVGLVVAVLAGTAFFQFRLRIQDQEAAATAEAFSVLALARQLAAQAQLVYEEEPLLGLRLALEARELFSQEAEDIPDDVINQIHTYMDNGWLATLGRDVRGFQDIPDTPWLLVESGAGELDELRRKSNGALIGTLAGMVDWIGTAGEDSPYFVVGYVFEPDELRRKSDGTLVETLAGAVERINTVGEDSPFFLVKYWDDTPDELRRKSDGALVETLDEAVQDIYPISEDSPLLLVDYADEPGQLRRKSDGALVETLAGAVERVDTVGEDSPYFVVEYRTDDDDGDGALVAELRRKQDGTLAVLEPPLAGAVDTIHSLSENSPFLLVDYVDELDELRRKSDGALIEMLAGAVERIDTVGEDSPFLLVKYWGEPAELRRKSDGALVETLAGAVERVDTVGEDSPYFVVKYRTDDDDGDGALVAELRRKQDGTLAVLEPPLAGAVDTIHSLSENSPFLLVDYVDELDELRRKSDGTLAVLEPPLAATGVQIDPVSKDFSYFVVEYRDDGDGGRGRNAPPSELRRKSDGALAVTFVKSLWLDRNVASNYFFARRSDQHTELMQVAPPLRLANLGLGIPWEDDRIDSSSIHFNEEQQTLAIRYEDGRAYLLDLAWLAAAQSSESLLDVACLPFHTRSVEATIRSKLPEAVYLGEREPQACSGEGVSDIQQEERNEPAAQPAN